MNSMNRSQFRNCTESDQFLGDLFEGRRNQSKFDHGSYQSEWGDHRAHERHWVDFHSWRHAGHISPVSNVFHSNPQVQNHLTSLRGDQPQRRQRMRGGSEVVGFFSSSSSGTTTGLSATVLTTVIMT
jgi:hypothetical protein